MVEGIAQILFEIIIQTLCFYIGFYFIKVITFGKYPKSKELANSSLQWLSALGFFLLLSPLIVYTTYAYLYH